MSHWLSEIYGISLKHPKNDSLSMYFSMDDSAHGLVISEIVFPNKNILKMTAIQCRPTYSSVV